MRDYIITTQRLGFSVWTAEDFPLAQGLWGDFDVMRMVTAAAFTDAQIKERLEREINNWELYKVQYWPMFSLDTGELVGCCGLRPYYDEDSEAFGKIYEMGFYLHKKFWRQGYGLEAARAVLDYAFNRLGADAVEAGHHPDNKSSRALIEKLGFTYQCDELYPPTGAYHPVHLLTKGCFCGNK